MTSRPIARRRSGYNLLERLEAGIVLQGSEVKSLRNGSVQLKDAYAEVRDGEVWLRNMHIAPYEPAREGHDPERPRKLLLHSREIERLIGKTAEKGLTIVPTRIYFSGSRAKVELAVAKGKEHARQAALDQGPRAEARDGPGAARALAAVARPARWPSPRSAAQRVSSWRLDSCSLRSTDDTCASTVFAEISRRCAISLYM